MRAEVLELPGVVDAARAVAEELGTAELVTHIAEDILDTELPRSYPLVFIGNLVHHLSPQQLALVVSKVRNHLVPGGTIAIWDISASGNDLATSLLALFFALTSSGKCHNQQEIQEVLQVAGFDQVRAIRPDGPALHTLHLARL